MELEVSSHQPSSLSGFCFSDWSAKELALLLALK